MVHAGFDPKNDAANNADAPENNTGRDGQGGNQDPRGNQGSLNPNDNPPQENQNQNQGRYGGQDPNQAKEPEPVQTVQEQKKNQKIKTKKDIEKQLIREIKTRIDCYFNVNVNQMADLVPKIIGHYLLTSSLKNMHFLVYKHISASESFAGIKEPEHIVTKRKTISSMLEVLRNSRKILLRDPDLAYSLSHLEKRSAFNKDSKAANIAPASGDKKKTDAPKGNTGKGMNTGPQPTLGSYVAPQQKSQAPDPSLFGKAPAPQHRQAAPMNQSPQNPQVQQQKAAPQPQQGWTSKMNDGFAKTQEKVVTNISQSIGKATETAVKGQMNKEIDSQKAQTGLFGKPAQAPTQKPAPKKTGGNLWG